MLQRLLGLKRRPDAADGLYAQAVEQARDPAFYGRLGVADRIDSRFDLYLLHVQLLILRLQAEGDMGRDLAQRLFDVFVSALDNDLRELGVGDLSIAKKMRKLSEHVYGRMSAYESGLTVPDEAALAEAIARNVAPAGENAAAILARYALATRKRLAAQSLDQVIATADWAEIAQ
ncbi:MAG: ubiquinol-cytochrome C chaperone [Caulobacteraceae bacterium]|nr:ubiquinol-cytochrome C chaperone [Caulobacteraceae bacterium]